jgi:hypothetical protein
MTRSTALLAARSADHSDRRGHRIDRTRLLRLRAEHPLAQISDLGSGGIQFALQAIFALSRLRHLELVSLVGKLKPANRTLMQRLPLPGLHDQFDMLALGQRDQLQLERLGRWQRRVG